MSQKIVYPGGSTNVYVLCSENVGTGTDGYLTQFIDGANGQIGDAIPLSSLLDIMSSGILTGGALSINADPTKYDLASGTGWIVDNFTDPASPTFTQVSWSNFTAQSVPNIATQVQTFIGINSSGAITEFTDFNDAARDLIVVGALIHPNFTTITSVGNYGLNLAYGTGNSLVDMGVAIGPLNESGNIFSANGANLNINKSTGVIFYPGINFKNDKKDPNRISIASSSPTSFFYTYRNGSGGWTNSASTTTIVPNKYDDGDGTLGTVNNNKWTIQRIYLGVVVVIQYGQTVYNSKAEALAAINTEVVSVNPALSAALLRGYLVSRGGATALNAVGDAQFIEASKFGAGASAGVTSSTTTLQQAYDNSVTPEFLTDSTRGAVTFRRGSAADTDSVIEGQNNAGSNTFKVTGNGLVNSATLTASRALASDSSKNIVSSSVTDTELGYLSGVTSAVQTQIDSKVPTTRTISTSSPLSGGGDLSTNRTLSITQSTSIQDGYLSSSDWTTFNSKQNNTNSLSAGVVSDAYYMPIYDSSADKKVTVAQLKTAASVIALSDAATIATDASLGNVFSVTLGGNRTLGAPTNPTSGQRCIWRITQDGTGSRTLAYNAVFRFGTDITSATLSTTAGKTDYLGCVYNAASSTWDVVAFVKGY